MKITWDKERCILDQCHIGCLKFAHSVYKTWYFMLKKLLFPSKQNYVAVATGLRSCRSDTVVYAFRRLRLVILSFQRIMLCHNLIACRSRARRIKNVSTVRDEDTFTQTQLRKFCSFPSPEPWFRRSHPR